MIRITREFGPCYGCANEDWNYWVVFSGFKQGIWICRACWRKIRDRMIQNAFPKKPKER